MDLSQATSLAKQTILLFLFAPYPYGILIPIPGLFIQAEVLQSFFYFCCL